jgi:hypothetical protein
MIKLVNFLKINFILIIVCFFLPFFPYFSCESSKESTSRIDSGSAVVDSVQRDGISGTKEEIPPSSSGSDKAGSFETSVDSDLANKKSASQRILDYLSFTKYRTPESDRSITGFGILVLFLESVFAGDFDISDWRSYLIPISFIACLLGLGGSIKSRKRKHQFLFICSALGLASFTLIGFLVGNIFDLLYGFWMILVLYLVNTLLSFILWKNYFVKDKS